MTPDLLTQPSAPDSYDPPPRASSLHLRFDLIRIARRVLLARAALDSRELAGSPAPGGTVRRLAS